MKPAKSIWNHNHIKTEAAEGLIKLTNPKNIKPPDLVYPKYKLKGEDSEYTKYLKMSVGKGDGRPTKKEMDIARKYNFTLPSLGGEPENVLLMQISHHRELNGKYTRAITPTDGEKLREAAHKLAKENARKAEKIANLMKLQPED